MEKPRIPISQKMFRAATRVLPTDFRENAGGEMEEVFRQQRMEAEERGGAFDFLRLWWETLTGLVQTAPREHWEILKSDVSYALRMMRKNPGFSVVAVLTLALGIGANTAIFSVVHSVLLRPLPFSDGQQLVLIHQQALNEGIGDTMFSAHEIDDYRQQNRVLSGLAELHNMSFILYGHGDPDRVRSAVVSANYFDLLKIKPLVGRTLTPEDDKPGAPPVLILTYEYWKEKFGGDPGIVGKTFEMNDKVHTVVGVLPPMPQYPAQSDVFMPTSACPFRSSKQFIEDRDSRMMQAFGRLKPGVSITAASADLAAVAGHLRTDYPKSYPENEGYTAAGTLLEKELTKGARPTLLVLLAAAGFVLLIACANVANLILARMARREREIAVRAALGAGRSRVLRQLFTESFLLAACGGILAILFAHGSLQLLSDFSARLTPRSSEIKIDGGVLLFTLSVALGTSLLFGTLAAFFARVNLSSSLSEGSVGAGSGRRKNRVRSVLIVSQVAFSFMLLIGAGLMLRSLFRLLQVNPGFAPQHALAMRTTFSFSKYKSRGQWVTTIRKVLQRVEEEPGVVSAALASAYPLEPEAIAMGPDMFSGSFQVEGRQLGPGEAPPVSEFVAISPDYFRTLGIPLLQGREFQETDGENGPLVFMINEAARRQIWGNQDPMGQHISADGGKSWGTIIGIAGNVREFGLNQAPAPEIYYPQTEGPNASTLVVRTAADPGAMSSILVRAVHDVDPQAAVTHIITLEQARQESVASPRVTASLLAIFGALALVIAAAGIGGIMALAVNQRVREMGIRIALGAQPSTILKMVLRQGLSLAGLGVAIGIFGALGLAKLVKSLLFEVAPTDSFTFCIVAALLLGAGTLATYLPARRAASIDPLVALRME